MIPAAATKYFHHFFLFLGYASMLWLSRNPMAEKKKKRKKKKKKKTEKKSVENEGWIISIFLDKNDSCRLKSISILSGFKFVFMFLF